MESNKIAEKKTKAELIDAINKPNPSEADRKALRELFESSPAFWQGISDLPVKLEDRIISEMCSTSYGAKEAFKKKLSVMRDNLGWDRSSEMEKILIEQVCLNWLRINLLENIHFSKTSENHSLENGIYWDKRLSSAQRRYLRAIDSLAKVRKLLAEAELKEQQARNKRSQSTAIAQKIYDNSNR